MAAASIGNKRDALRELADEISSREGWWLFPSEGSIQGFMGRGPVFIVGDQPSLSEWPPEHPCRRVFYDTLKKVGLTNAHLTDLYKKRGLPSALANGLPPDFTEHLNLFRNEMEILKPKLIVALGELVQRLLIQNLTEWDIAIPRIWHFSYVARTGRESKYEAHIREIIPDTFLIPKNQSTDWR